MEFVRLPLPLLRVGRGRFFDRNIWPDFRVFCIQRQPFLKPRLGVGLDRVDRAFRLADPAIDAFVRVWWIKAAIQEYILRSWSLVKMGTTANQKKLFFNLRKAQSKISILDDGDMRLDQVKIIARRIGVTEMDVIYMRQARPAPKLRVRGNGARSDWAPRFLRISRHHLDSIADVDEAHLYRTCGLRDRDHFDRTDRW